MNSWSETYQEQGMFHEYYECFTLILSHLVHIPPVLKFKVEQYADLLSKSAVLERVKTGEI